MPSLKLASKDVTSLKICHVFLIYKLFITEIILNNLRFVVNLLFIPTILTTKTMRITSALLLFLTFTISCSENAPKQTEATENVFSTQNLPTQVFEITNENDTFIIGKNGTKISIPKNSFVDKNGNAVTGKINFELKEALTLADMVMGNLTTLSNGKILQTGGMIYTNATANGENLLIANNKALQISVPTDNKNDSMLIFEGEVNPENQSINWVNPKDIIEKNKPTVVSKTISRPIFYEHKNREVPLLAVPKKPIEYIDDTERLLSIDFETNDMFPELQQFKNVKFKVSEKSSYNPEEANKTWYDVKLEKTNEEGIYKVIFKGVDKGKMIEQSYFVSPAFEGNDYKKALAIYEQKFKQYEKKKKEINENKERLEREAEKLANQAKKAAFEAEKIALEAKKKALQNAADLIKSKEKKRKSKGINLYSIDENVNYIFQQKMLGWANIDRFYKDKRIESINQVITVDEDFKKDNVYMILLFAQQNVILRGYEKKDGTYGFSHKDREPTNLPVGEEAIILATTYRNNIPYFAFQKIIIERKQNINLSLKETTKLKLEAYLKENI